MGQIPLLHSSKREGGPKWPWCGQNLPPLPPLWPRARGATQWNGAARSFFVQTTTAPEDGRATTAVAQALAHGLGVAKSRLVLVRGAAPRDKVFRLT